MTPPAAWCRWTSVDGRARSPAASTSPSTSTRSPECTYAAVEWWVGSSRGCEVPHLLIVPNEPTELLTPGAGRHAPRLPARCSRPRATGSSTRAGDRRSGGARAAAARGPLPPVRARGSVATLHVACAAEGDYVPHSAAMLHSVLAHRGAPGRARALPARPGLARASPRAPAAEMVERLGGANRRSTRSPTSGWPGSRSSGSSPRRCGTGSSCPSCCPDVDRVLYLDADTIVDGLARAAVARRTWAATTLGAVTNVFQANHVAPARGARAAAGPRSTSTAACC